MSVCDAVLAILVFLYGYILEAERREQLLHFIGISLVYLQTEPSASREVRHGIGGYGTVEYEQQVLDKNGDYIFVSLDAVGGLYRVASL